MGGGISSLSKICVVGPSTHPDTDGHYTFIAIGIKNCEVDFLSNCGNMTSAVGPFAVDAKIVPVDSEASGDVTVRIHNRIRVSLFIQFFLSKTARQRQEVI